MDNENKPPAEPAPTLDYGRPTPNAEKQRFALDFIYGFFALYGSCFIGIVFAMWLAETNAIPEWIGVPLVLVWPIMVFAWGILNCLRRRAEGVLAGALIAALLGGFVALLVG